MSANLKPDESILLREDRERGLTPAEVPVEALYDETTGLPV